MNKMFVRAICILCSFVIIVLCTSCTGGSDKKSVDDKKPNKTQEDTTETINDSGIESEKVVLYIDEAKPFYDGEALVELVNRNREPVCYAVIDTSGNVLSTFNNLDYYYNGCYNNRYYYYSGYEYLCVDSHGKEVYNISFVTDDSTSNYRNYDLNFDGTLSPLRDYGGFEQSSTQIAFIDCNGNYIRDWEYVYYNGEHINVKSSYYIGEGYILLYDDNGTYLFNMRSDEIVNLGKVGGTVGEIVEGYFIIGGRVYSLEGELKCEFSPYGRLPKLVENNGKVCIWCPDELCFYDITGENKVSKIDVPEEVAAKDFWYDSFIDGYMPISFTGSDNRIYTTLVDCNGQMQFEPICTAGNSMQRYDVVWNGTNLIVLADMYNVHMKVYNIEGEEIKTIDLRDGVNGVNYEWDSRVAQSSFSDGFIVLKCYETSVHSAYRCYMKSDGDFLFPNGEIKVSLGEQ